MVTSRGIIQRGPKGLDRLKFQNLTGSPGELCNAYLGAIEWVPLMIMDCKFTMADGAGDMKLLALADFGDLFNFMSSLVAKHLGWAIKPKNTPVAAKLSNGTIVHSSGATNGLVSSGIWQAYLIFLVVVVPFRVILGMPWLSLVRLGGKGISCTTKGLLAQASNCCK